MTTSSAARHGIDGRRDARGSQAAEAADQLVYFGNRGSGVGVESAPAIVLAGLGTLPGSVVVGAGDAIPAPWATSAEPWRLGLLDSPAMSGAENTIVAHVVRGSVIVLCAAALAAGAGQSPGRAPTKLSPSPVTASITTPRRRREDDTSTADVAPSATSDQGSAAGDEAVVIATAAEQVAEIQVGLGLPRSTVAELLGVTRQTLHAWINEDVVAPRDRSRAARLRLLYDLAMAWERRNGPALRPWLDVRVPGGTLRELLATSEWDQRKLDRALNAISEHHERRQVEQRQAYEALASMPRPNDLDELAKSRQTMRRIRRLRG